MHEIREERLANMLAADVLENDGIWTNYEWEEGQTIIDAADLILESLADELLDFLENKL